MINQVLLQLIPADVPLALFDFPNYSNVGDSAIWLGQIEFIKNLGLHRLKINDTHIASWTPGLQLPKNTVILINGGGNFGDLYPRHQNLRLHLARTFRQHRIIQLPQSIHFDHKESMSETVKVLNDHPDFHLLVRDRQSLELAQKIHKGNSQLCPDMALYLDNISRPCQPKFDIVALMRNDKEKKISGQEKIPSGVYATDWLDEPVTNRIKWSDWLEGFHSRRPRWLKVLFRFKYPFYSQVARERMTRGCTLLSSGKVVITDRLHVHILCSLMDIPHVVLENSYRKIGNLMDVWNTGSGICQRADSFDEALLKAKNILGSM